MSKVVWEKICSPLEHANREEFHVIEVMSKHIKYCPADNPEEIHIISKADFIKKFKQSS